MPDAPFKIYSKYIWVISMVNVTPIPDMEQFGTIQELCRLLWSVIPFSWWMMKFGLWFAVLIDEGNSFSPKLLFVPEVYQFPVVPVWWYLISFDKMPSSNFWITRRSRQFFTIWWPNCTSHPEPWATKWFDSSLMALGYPTPCWQVLELDWKQFRTCKLHQARLRQNHLEISWCICNHTVDGWEVGNAPDKVAIEYFTLFTSICYVLLYSKYLF